MRCEYIYIYIYICIHMCLYIMYTKMSVISVSYIHCMYLSDKLLIISLAWPR